MLLLPEPGKDETLYSLVARIARMNGVTNHVELMRTLLGEERPTSAIDARVNLDAFCDATHGAYGEPQEVLQRFSALPLRAHLAELDDSQFSGIARGDLRRTFSEVAFGGRCNWRVCRACIDQDLNVIGIAYWHRVHQLPTSQWCPEHGIPLQPYDLIRARLHERLFLPCDLVDQRTPELGLSQRQHHVWMLLAELGRDALADSAKPLPSSVILDTFVLGLRERGLLTHGGKLRLPALDEALELEFGAEAETLKASILDATSAASSKQSLSGLADRRPCRSFSRLALVHWLFGRWAAFKERCQWQAVINEGLRDQPAANVRTSQQPTEPAGELATAIERFRQVCLDYKTSHPNPTRLEFLKVSYRAFRWLHNNDSAWLDEQLPLPPRSKQPDLFD